MSAAKINWTKATIIAVKNQAALEKAVLAIPAVKDAKTAPVLVFVSAGCDRCSEVEKTIAACDKFTYIKVDVSGMDKKASPAANQDNAPIAILVANGKVAKVITGPNPQGFADLTKEMQKLNK